MRWPDCTSKVVDNVARLKLSNIDRDLTLSRSGGGGGGGDCAHGDFEPK